MSCSFRPRNLALALAACLLLAAGAHAAEVCLVAKPFMATGAAAGVPMWGYAQAPFAENTCDWASAGPASSPGPRITVQPEDTSLTIHLLNNLPAATSIVIPGLPFTPGTITRIAGRAASLTSEVAAAQCSAVICLPGQGALTGEYTWSNLRPGTYLYHSGSHVQVQVQMGLYGAVTKDTAANTAYGRSYSNQVVLFYSEVDPTLHQAVATGSYGGLLPIPTSDGTAGTPTMTSTFDYEPRYFLVNGDAYPAASTGLTAGAAAETTLIRFLNAGLRTHVPTLLNGDFELLAEDAHAYPYSRRQVQISLPAGKTTDVLWTPAYAGTYPVFDRAPHLTTNGDGPGGMIATLTVGGTITARTDIYGARNDRTLVVGAPGVMANDSAITTATLVAGVPEGDGTLLFNSDGSFTYSAPTPTFTGPVAFQYQQPGSNVATATITVGANVAPVAVGQQVPTTEDTPRPITLTATDDNSDPLTYAIGTGPAHGTLGGTLPNVMYTPAPNYNGQDSFTFTASDDLLTSTPATVAIDVSAVNDAPAAAPATWSTNEDTPRLITLTGSDIDGNSLTFRVTTNPANGTLSGLTHVPPTTATVTYTPRLDYFGTDSFRFVVNDGTVDSPVATISIPVAAVADNPIAVNDSYSTKYNTSLTMNVLSNDRDPDGTPLTINNSPVTFPKCFNSTTGAFINLGSACASSTGVDKVTLASAQNRLTLAPYAGVRRNRTLSFQYQAKDGSGALSNLATVTVNVTR